MILPLGALALLSTLFLLARRPAEQPNIPFAEIEAMARDQRITAPKFSGLTEDGAIIVISARSAQPDMTRPDTVSVDTMAFRMDNPDGSYVTVTATRGEVDGRSRIARFLGLARVETSTGYEMETNGLIAELDTGLVTSDGLLEIRAPFGELTAGKVTFQLSQDNTGQQILFTDGVRLIYRPQD
ncbi:LPS export ABC transporter periplasmic protein LptC [Yoonia sp.]|uniref:LPS export ABC transporter periplasmic protein LptC n=1 Tax=Yoonia sp. TaxID=2212373 RepID=UPI0025F970B5|nr:LPS export ABC transporter periplasmic protein LptC [Yoonia sp.]